MHLVPLKRSKRSDCGLPRAEGLVDREKSKKGRALPPRQPKDQFHNLLPLGIGYGLIFIIEDATYSRVTWDIHLHSCRDYIVVDERKFCMFDGTSRILCTMSSWNQIYWAMNSAVIDRWSNWTVHCASKRQNNDWNLTFFSSITKKPFKLSQFGRDCL